MAVLSKSEQLKLSQKAEGVSFLFFMFLLYLFFLYLRPVELWFAWMADFRPMMIIWLISFGGSLVHVLRHKDAAATSKHYWILITLMLAVALSLIFKGRVGDAMLAVADFSASVLLFFLVSFNLLSMRRLRIACGVILFCLVSLSVLGILAYHTGYMSEELVLQQRKDDWTIEAPTIRPPIPGEDKSGAFLWRVRGVGILNDPNDFAQALIMGMPMLWWFVRKGAWLRNLIFVGGPAALMGYCMTLTNSRGAILGAASLLFFGIRQALGNFRTILLMGAGGAGSMVIGMAGGREFSTKERSAEERIEAWYEGINMLKSSPLFGVGYGTFTERYYLTAHNSFVLGFAELGLFGYFFWIALLVLGFTTVNRVATYAPKGSPEMRAGNILRSSLVGYMTCAWFLSRTYQPVLFCLLALCTAVWVCAKRSPACANIPEIQAPLKWVKPTLAGVVLSILAVDGFIIMHGH